MRSRRWMLRVAALSALCLLPAPAHPNQMFELILRVKIAASKSAGGHEILATGRTVNGESISIHATSEGQPERLQKLSVLIGETRIDIPEPALLEIVEPRFRKLLVINDTGVFGDYFSVVLPFGKRTSCEANGRKGRAELVVDLSRNGSIRRVSVYDPCGRPVPTVDRAPLSAKPSSTACCTAPSLALARRVGLAEIPDMAHPLFDFSRLTPEERIQLAEDLWDSLVPTPETLPLSDAQAEELDRRAAAYRADGDPGRPWRDVLDEIERDADAEERGRRGG